jgi:O-antigen ligase
MKIQGPAFSRIFNLFLALIAATIVFRKPCTWLLIGFAVFNIACIRQVKLNKTTLWLTGFIALPFLLEIIFFWNNSSVSAGFKSAEKTISMLLLPLFILGNYRYINLNSILFTFGRLLAVFLLFCVIRFVILYPENIQNYLKGIDLWDSGYALARSFKTHAPAVNMHMGFAAMVNFYFALHAFIDRKSMLHKSVSLAFFALSVLLVLVLNTRLAVALLFAGCGIILLYELLRVKNGKKILGFAAVAAIIMVALSYVYVQNNEFVKRKFTSLTFDNLDKVGRLDEFKYPELEVYNGLVTRLSIWKSGIELAAEEMPFGVGSSNVKDAIRNNYLKTNQQFLYRQAFPAHNQLIDMAIRFGILGIIGFLAHMAVLGRVAFKTRHSLAICFFMVFFLSNMVDDFLIRFDGIVFCAVWFSVFAAYWLQNRLSPGRVPAAA